MLTSDTARRIQKQTQNRLTIDKYKSYSFFSYKTFQLKYHCSVLESNIKKDFLDVCKRCNLERYGRLVRILGVDCEK